MTENIPPVPPAPQYPAQPPAGYGQTAPQPFAPPPGYGQQPYPQQMQYAPYPPQQFAPAGQWSHFGPPPPKSSGYRVTAGIVGIVLGAWLFLQFLVGVSLGLGFLAFLSLVVAVGTLTSGIVLLAKQRGRLRGAPITVLSFVGFALLVGLIHLGTSAGAGMFVFTFLLSVPVLIVMGLGLSREKRGA